VEGLTPYLAQTVVPEVLAAAQQHLVTTAVPDIVDGVTQHLVDTTVPRVVEGVTPLLVSELLPRILQDLRPYLEQEVIPEIVDALVPRLTSVVVPQILEQIMPMIETDIAPRLVDSLMPKIRNEVVPVILEDIVDDPSVRDLIREQSQGLFLDAMESIRENMADVDNMVETICRKVVRKPPRVQPPSGLELVLDATGGGERARTTLSNLSQQRATWQAMKKPPAPPGREFAYAGIVTRFASFVIDVTLLAWLVSQGLSALLSLLESLFGTLPTWLVAILGILAWSLVPIYLAATWSIMGRSLGMWVIGTRVCTADGRHPGFWRALARALLELLGFWAFLITASTSLFDDRRRSILDIVARTEVRFVVPKEQQARYIRDALHERKQAAAAD
jgi:uncharacterized RDD family membrane protein YckC